MKKLYSFLAALFMCLATHAQEPTMLQLEGWGGANTDDVSISIPTYDGGFVLSINSSSLPNTGNIDSFSMYNGSKRIFRKYNSDASLIEWTRWHGDDGDSTLWLMFPRPDGTSVLGGGFGPGSGWGYIIQKRGIADNIVWERQYSRGSNAILRDMIETSDGGYVMLGSSTYTDTNILVHYGNWMDRDIWVLKLDSMGIKQWSVVIGGSGDELVGKVLEGVAGCLYIAGRSKSNDYDIANNHGIEDAIVAKLDKDGNKIWVKTYGGSEQDISNSLCHDGNGGILVTGYTSSGDGDVNGYIVGSNVWVINLDSSGNILWNNCYGGAGNEIGNVIAKAGDGSIWVGCDLFGGSGGQIDTIYSNADGWLLHIDNAGNFINAKVMGSTGPDKITVIQPLAGNTVLAGGYYRKANGVFNMLTNYGESDAFISTFSPWTTSIDQSSLKPNTISISPNPATNEVKIKVLSKANKKYRISIINVDGREVYKKTIHNELTLFVSDWTKGIYTVVVSDGNERIGNAKLLVP